MLEQKLIMGREEVRDLFPPLPLRANKGMMGRVLAVCGCYDGAGPAMSGAALFAASAAYRCGAGIVEVFTPKENYPALASRLPEAVYSLYGCEEGEGTVTVRLQTALSRADAVILGCGLGRSALAAALVRTVLTSCRVPLLIDADGLNILSEEPGLWSLLSAEQGCRTVITPHPGEMSRLCGKSIAAILKDPADTAFSFARERGITCLLKDHDTVITDGKAVYLNQSGNPGMATAGMGDVLSGILGALLARWDPEVSLCRLTACAAYLHGLAGDSAAARLGQYSLLASDLLNEIPATLVGLFDKK